jgi:hypothetical protein
MRRVHSVVLAALAIVSFSSALYAQTKTREQLIEEIGKKRTELSGLETQFLAVSPDDEKAFAELLNQPNTGVIRLLPREGLDSAPQSNQPNIGSTRLNSRNPNDKPTYVSQESLDVAAASKKQKTLTITGGGSYYSFVKLTHEYGRGSDISLERDHLKVGFAGADYGMIVKLGDIAIENLSVTHPLVVPLTRYIPAKTLTDARVEQKRFSSETEIEGLPLKDRVPAEVNATYLLRSISYGDSDVLVAIKVARKDSDGSLIIAWKLLEKYSVPHLAEATNIVR